MSRIKNFYSVNSFFPQICYKYYKSSTNSEKIFDVLIPIFLSVGLVILIYTYYSIDLFDLLQTFLTVNTVVISSMAILVGFNIASIAVIAGSQSNLVTNLRSRASVNMPGETVFSVLVIYFTWSILIQLLVILLGVLGFFCLNFYPIETLKSISILWWHFVLLGTWFFLILHSIFVSFRNIKMLYHFVNFKDTNEE